MEYRAVSAGQSAGGGDAGNLFSELFGNFRGGGGARRGPQKGGDVEQPVDVSFAESVRGTQRRLNLIIRSDDGREEKRDVTVKIPPGVSSGTRVKVSGKGASSASGGTNGDLFLLVQVRADPFWKRDGNNLKIEVPVSFARGHVGRANSGSDDGRHRHAENTGGHAERADVSAERAWYRAEIGQRGRRVGDG